MDCDTWEVPGVGACSGGCSIPEDTDPDLLEAASVRAGVILHTLSGGRAGTCTDVLRPIGECCGMCRGACRCAGSGDRIRLQSPVGPVTGVTEVKVAGQVVPPELWRYYPSSETLYRVPEGVWPRVDRKWAGCEDPETMCVEVVVGYEPDAWAISVHAELTCELLASCTGGKCRIPKNASQVSGQGVTITLTPTEASQFIPAVAGWVAAINPDNAQNVPKSYSPDTAMLGGSGCGCS